VKEPSTIKLKLVGADDSNKGENKHTKETPVEKDARLEKFLGSEDPQIEEHLREQDSTFLAAYRRDIEKNSLELRYATKADISKFVSYALVDALGLITAKTGKTFWLHHEVSIFSDCPDHVVVVDSDTETSVLAVEDKKPFYDDIGELGYVLGQVFDYVMSMKLFGDSTPFAVLSTFERSWLCWQDDPESNKLASNQKARVEILEGTSTDSSSKKEKTPSPLDLKKEDVLSKGDCEFIETADTETERRLCISKAVDSKDLVRLFYTAMLCGLSRNPNARKHVLKGYLNGYSGQALRLRRDKEGYTWGNLVSKGSSSKGNLEIAKDPAAYYIIDLIGRGQTSKAFLAFDANGEECVIKMYVKRDDEDGNILDEQEMDALAKKQCTTEVANLKKLSQLIG
jgi:hypothetical protein